MSVSSFVAKVGVNPDFIAFQAHCWFAFAIVFVSPWHDVAALLAFGAAVAKEFWFDATYEVPKQTWQDNALDLAGYSTGIALALLAVCVL